MNTIKDLWFWLTIVTGAIAFAQGRWFKDYQRIIAKYQQMLDETMAQNKGLIAMNNELLDAANKSDE